MRPSVEPVAVSAPGKVLFSGGFLVLDRKHTGLVFGLNARIHVRVDGWHRARDSSEQLSHILVQSPQFLDARWLYGWKNRPDSLDSGIGVHQIIDDTNYSQNSNKFVETTLEYVLTYLMYARTSVDDDIKITVAADDDYYSHDLPRSPGNFTEFGVSLRDAHKTGLGSSAALVTALVAGLLAYFTGKVPRTDTDKHLRTIHNLAQASHCAAQGKVGSGFDVAAAVYGSCLYRRFTPDILEDIGDSSLPDFPKRLYRCIEDLNLVERSRAHGAFQQSQMPSSTWDEEVLRQAVRIPDSLRLVMCDVDCGSETPSMVRKVLAWRRDDYRPPSGVSESTRLWAKLQEGTDLLCTTLTQLSNAPSLSSQYEELRDIISAIRSHVRTMSERSGVPIEPPVITELLDHCTSLPGVIGGVAPGAGGYDAIALLVKNDEKVVGSLQEALTRWQSESQKHVTDGPRIGRVSLLAVKQDYAGLRVEDPLRYEGWTNEEHTSKRDAGFGSNREPQTIADEEDQVALPVRTITENQAGGDNSTTLPVRTKTPAEPR